MSGFSPFEAGPQIPLITEGHPAAGGDCGEPCLAHLPHLLLIRWLSPRPVSVRSGGPNGVRALRNLAHTPLIRDDSRERQRGVVPSYCKAQTAPELDSDA